MTMTAREFLDQYRRDRSVMLAEALADTQRLWNAEIKGVEALQQKCGHLEERNAQLMALVREAVEKTEQCARFSMADWRALARALLDGAK